MPRSRRTRSTSAASSFVARWYGHGTTAERIADHEVGTVRGDVAEVAPAVTGAHPQPVRQHEAELVLGDVDHGRVELQHEAVRARTGRLDVAGDREPAAAEVHGGDR